MTRFFVYIFVSIGLVVGALLSQVPPEARAEFFRGLFGFSS